VLLLITLAPAGGEEVLHKEKAEKKILSAFRLPI
jgi:hypothetical protein